MDRDKYSMIVGTAFLIIGLVVLFYVLSLVLPIAANPGKFVDDQFPVSNSTTGPSSSFNWNTNNLNLSVSDHSQQGSSPIVTHYWNFGDGHQSQDSNPTYTYSNSGNYQVTLKVTDQNGKSSESIADINVQTMGSNNGNSQSPDNNNGPNIDMGAIFRPMAGTILVMSLYLIAILIGGFILKAGWMMIKPTPETIRLRIKRKDIDFEPVEPQKVVIVNRPESPPSPSAPKTTNTVPNCKKCGKELDPEFTICPFCGTSR